MANLPFLPQEGITNGILSAIQLANQQHQQQQQNAVAQQNADTAQQEAQTATQRLGVETPEIGARTANLKANTQLTQADLAQRTAATAWFSGSPDAPANDPAHVDQVATQMAGPHALDVSNPLGQNLTQPTAPPADGSAAPTTPPNSGPKPTGVNQYIDALDKKVGLLPEERSAIDNAAQLAAPTHDIAGFQKQVQSIVDKRNDPAYARYVAYRQQGLSADAAHQKIASIDAQNAALTKIETDPAELSGDKAPAAVSQLQGMLKSADDTQKPRIKSLLATAQTAVQANLAFDAAKKRADKAAQDGDPVAAGHLLASGMAAPNELTTGRNSAFAVKAFDAANQESLKTTGKPFNAQQAQANFDVAKSPTNVGFFGSAKSLTDPGGSLDQLEAAAKDIPNGKIPVFNSIADAQKAAMGSGPIAKYASIALLVADDGAKVAGGGVGSDTGREQFLKLIPTNASPEARKGAVQGIRGGVDSQMTSRIGDNPVLRSMYGNNVSERPGSGGGYKVGDTITQNGHTYTVKSVSNGKVTDAE